MASHSGKVTFGHSKFWWEVGRWSKKPCHEIPSVVFFKLTYRWFSLFKTLSVNFTGTAAKWYIELLQYSFVDFGSLATIFLTHFQLPIHYETGTDILTSLRQNTSTHISDHIHEWRRWKRLIKAPIPDHLLADWFTKSLFPLIAWDVAMGSFITE